MTELNCVFLERVLRTLGFSSLWVQSVMDCVRTVTYSYRVNGDFTGCVVPGRGIRQGDPISPYLFILIAEAFSSLINHVVLSNSLHGIRVCRGSPVVSQLFFANDSLLFFRANGCECLAIVDIMNKYEVVFEQKNNKYLGLPTLFGRSKREIFGAIKDGIWTKLQGWQGKQLSRAGKEIMIKTVAQSVPTYVIGLIRLPTTIIDDINRMISNFWWGLNLNHRGIH